MTAATPFSFDTDFRGPNPGRRISDVDVAAAREQGFQEGLAQGRRQAQAEQEAALTHMAGVLAQQAQALLPRRTSGATRSRPARPRSPSPSPGASPARRSPTGRTRCWSRRRASA